MSSDTEQPCDPNSGPCRDALQNLFVYIDGQLTMERRLVIKEHIDRCSHCFERFSFELELRQVVAQSCRDTVPESLKMRIAEAIGCDLDSELPPCCEQESPDSRS